MNIAVFSTYSYDEEFLTQHNTGHNLTFFKLPLNLQTANLVQGFTAVCVFVNDTVNAEVLSAIKQHGVRLIVLRCAGFNNVDIKAADALGIPVLRVPAYSPEAVAEHTVALMLTLNRKTHKAYNRVREGNFSLERLLGFNLHNRKVGIIGTGNIGKAVCNILNGFGCNIYAYDVYPDAALEALGVTYAPLEDVLRDADVVSLHCPLMEGTRHLINAETLKLFKPGAMLINTSRGGLINTPDVIEALKDRQLGYLGLDVYEQEGSLFFQDLSEDVIQDDLIMRLISFPNVLITSHQGFFTREALEQIATTTFANVDAFAAQQELVNRVVV
ncbi:2-hydroxyacid dehydrogenase [Flavobacterium akiainvivens]|uniref:2-hydroxyacid dehydrogenase n=1 Tax=Flavobacterium akiainvivens TaxID=1202724 RepID=A0A0M8MKB5_9FLAO|nr:2-hydroxyacid dehydrogenase [Flavobacterium akiainvivens]KOS07597.1 2-hydroxyacid dehydrogenase [Flavobacterium akiainvivens]SFQ22445.1 D-lactate dehydrogenase [Flavobacterium akiainvivens]